MDNTKPENARKPWTEEEMFLVASYAPTWRNVEFLAKHLKRTTNAIRYFYVKLYTKSTKLKEWAKDEEQYAKILKIRKALDIAIGM